MTFIYIDALVKRFYAFALSYNSHDFLKKQSFQSTFAFFKLSILFVGIFIAFWQKLVLKAYGLYRFELHERNGDNYE